jgi:hypothetical protein
MNAQEQIAYLLADPERLLERKPFTRGADMTSVMDTTPSVYVGGKVRARLPKVKRNTISQDQYIAELDPNMHTVLFDDNIPSICVKFNDGSYQDRQFVKTAIPFQRSIMEKQTLHMASLPMKFTLSDKKPTAEMQEDFVTFKHYWDLRNQDGMKVKMVATAKSYGDAGLLYYIDRHGEIKSRLLSYADGYVICSHNDENGDRLMESVYYTDGEKEYIDSWDDTNMYRYELSEKGEWTLSASPHGFSEIPLITKRTQVAWENVQSLCDSYETLYNIFQVLQKKWGWGMLYVKGRIDENARKIAGNIVLNDTSYDGNGDAKFLEPPSPQNMIDTLESIFDNIQKGSGTTFILPKDIHTSSDTSGIAVQMTQSLDIQTARNGIVEWQNVADKMVRLFKEGLATELRDKGTQADAVPRFKNLNVNASFDIWQPYSDSEYNQMISTMVNSGILSKRTGIEQNTISRPDEVERCEKEDQETLEKELEKERRTKELEAKYSTDSQNQQGGTKQAK